MTHSFTTFATSPTAPSIARMDTRARPAVVTISAWALLRIAAEDFLKNVNADI